MIYKFYQNSKRKTSTSLLEKFIYFCPPSKTAVQQSQVMRKNLTFDDLYFVRMKFEKAIQLPKAPPKTPKKQQNSFLAKNQAQKPFSPLESKKQQKQQPTQYQIDTWIAKKQVSVKAEIIKQKILNKRLMDQSQTIRLRKKENWEMLKRSKSPHKREQPQKMTENQIFPLKSHQKISNSQSKMKNMSSNQETKNSKSNSTQSDQVQSRERSNSNLNYFSFLLKSKQKSYSGLKNSQKSSEMMKNRQKKKTSITKSYSDLKLSPKPTSYSQRTIEFSNINHGLQTATSIQRFSQTRKMPQKSAQGSPYSSNKSPRINPIYYDNTKGNRLIKKYENREVSPVERRDLKDKYSHLERRLESILRSVNTEKLSSN